MEEEQILKLGTRIIFNKNFDIKSLLGEEGVVANNKYGGSYIVEVSKSYGWSRDSSVPEDYIFTLGDQYLFVNRNDFDIIKKEEMEAPIPIAEKLSSNIGKRVRLTEKYSSKTNSIVREGTVTEHMGNTLAVKLDDGKFVFPCEPDALSPECEFITDPVIPLTPSNDSYIGRRVRLIGSYAGRFPPGSSEGVIISAVTSQNDPNPLFTVKLDNGCIAKPWGPTSLNPQCEFIDEEQKKMSPHLKTQARLLANSNFGIGNHEYDEFGSVIRRNDTSSMLMRGFDGKSNQIPVDLWTMTRKNDMPLIPVRDFDTAWMHTGKKQSDFQEPVIITRKVKKHSLIIII